MTSTRISPSATIEIDPFTGRHVGPTADDVAAMLTALGYESLDDFIDATVPEGIRYRKPLEIGEARTDTDVLREIRAMAGKNRVFRSYLGLGYYDTITPPVIQRNVLEDPGWYTAYTPYQAEIAQGRLEALLIFQTLVMDLTALEMANASLLDEGTAAAEGIAMAHAVKGSDEKRTVVVSRSCHPQTIDVVRTRSEARGWTLTLADDDALPIGPDVFAVLLQYPATDGAIRDYREVAERTHANDALLVVASDLLALTMLTPPGEWGADVCVGNSQRFGVPMGYGGPHAAFFATRDEYRRHMPGRLIGVSRDASGRQALRMALQTREQHIRREKATSNVCTAQVLLAVMAAMYAVWHGPVGLKRIARNVHRLARALADGAEQLGHTVSHADYFDTVRIEPAGRSAASVIDAARERGINLRAENGALIVALDEATSVPDVRELLVLLGAPSGEGGNAAAADGDEAFDERFRRTTPFCTHPVFGMHHSETEMLRYLHKLKARDLSLTHSMIPLGSCTMKLNATAEMMPVTWPEFGALHPFAPVEQAQGYAELFAGLEHDLAEITGYAAVSLQPNAGSQGEFAGLMTIRAYHVARGDGARDVCLIPQSAHGTNPASAVMAGMQVVPVRTDANGNIDVADLRAQAEKHAARLSALMVTYPSTHGVFEESIRDICAIVHEHGGQVYLDGANMNAMVGIARPGDIGADVGHLNLHKTFCIPHGGGGPGMGPIGVAAHLVPFLPGNVVVQPGSATGGAISAAPWGSASILPISWVYLRAMGGEGLTHASKVAMLNANYVARRLEPHYPVLYKGRNGNIAHECIIDPRAFKASAGVEVEDIAKRLMDYGFHAPTVSFPVAGTLMIEPTESESKAELDRFCEAMIAIREEVADIERGVLDREDNPLKHAPHTMDAVVRDDWSHGYSRERAAFPARWSRESKFWPYVGRVEGAWGDRNLMCACPPMEAYMDTVI
ncbi:MAG TPA: aminomethyl-transferring glycine dehydrogenase [Gemmatimonadaceae bacterium]|nr:aminomethyl-transferring glycine dehydrogenase [Gemmatimonadaceae bacterium]